jgi:hypothetical protein
MERIDEIKIKLYDNARAMAKLQQEQRILGTELAELEKEKK